MPSFTRSTTTEAQLARQIDALIALVQKPRAFVIPILQTDPVETDGTNLWMRPDGRLRGRYFNGTVYVYTDYPLRTDITAPPAVPAAPAAPGKPPATRTFKSTWSAIWTQTYKGDNSKRTDDRGDNFIVYGNSGDSFNGTNKALIGFDYAAIASALAGSTIKAVQFTMTNVHAYWNSGVDVYFGMHNVTSEPSSWPSSGSLPVRRAVHSHYGKPQTKTVSFPIDFASRLRAGTAKGLAVEAPSSSKDYYGYAGGVGSGYTAPKLTITYAK